MGALNITIAPPEYVIARKLQYSAQGGGDRHVRDMARMLEREVLPIDRETGRAFAESSGRLPMWELPQKTRDRHESGVFHAVHRLRRASPSRMVQ